MPTLYTMPGTCALATNIAVAWLDAPVEVSNMAYGDHKKDGYLAINPKGKVPAVAFEDGDVLTEAAAILSWLGAEHGTEGYARDKVLGRKEAEALSYLTSEVHADFGPHFAVKTYAGSKDAQDEVKAAAYDKLRKHFERLEANFNESDGEWYLSERSFADAYLYVVTRWIEQTPLSIDDYPTLRSFRDRMQQDDGVKLALARQDMKPV
jgi:glutathione S-transferase